MLLYPDLSSRQIILPKRSIAKKSEATSEDQYYYFDRFPLLGALYGHMHATFWWCPGCLSLVPFLLNDRPPDKLGDKSSSL